MVSSDLRTLVLRQSKTKELVNKGIIRTWVWTDKNGADSPGSGLRNLVLSYWLPSVTVQFASRRVQPSECPKSALSVSQQGNYDVWEKWRGRRDSNSRPPPRPYPQMWAAELENQN